jgi:hypothetical protein
VPSQADLQGAWRLVSREVAEKKERADGLMLFSGHYMSFITTGERPDIAPELHQKPLADLTEAEKQLFLEAYRKMTSAAGTFVVEEGEIVFSLQVSRQPRMPKAPEKRKSWLEGDRLVQDFVNTRGVHSVLVWERAR